MHDKRVGVIILAAVLLAGCGQETPQEPDQTGPGTVEPDTVAPAAIVHLLVKSPTATSLALVWNAPGDDGNTGTAAGYDIRYSTDSLTVSGWTGAERFDYPSSPRPAGYPETVRVGGLCSLTRYFFGVKTRDEAGNESALSAIGAGATLRETHPPAPVEDLLAESLTDSTVRLTWTAPGDDGTVGRATQYDIRYHPSKMITDNNWDLALSVGSVPAPSEAGEPEALVLNGSSYTDCFFAVKTADESSNWSEVSNAAFSLGPDNFLHVYPSVVHAGESTFVYFRAPSSQPVSIRVHQNYTLETACLPASSHPFVYADIVDDEFLSAGPHTTTFDFRFINGVYFPPKIYVISICWGQDPLETESVDFLGEQLPLLQE